MKRIIIFLLAVLLIVFGYANFPMKTLPENAKADLIKVEKAKRQLSLWHQGQLVKTYRVSLGFQPTGAKRQQGDGKTPEGTYVIDFKKRDSDYHRALHISYPDARDIKSANARGVSPGGDVMIHGLKNGYGWIGRLHRYCDWTLGCIAVTNAEIEEIWRVIPDNVPVEIYP